MSHGPETQDDGPGRRLFGCVHWAVADEPLLTFRSGLRLPGSATSWMDAPTGLRLPHHRPSLPRRPCRPTVLRQGRQDSELESGLTWPGFDDMTNFTGLRIAVKLRRKWAASVQGAPSVLGRPNLAMTGILPASSVSTGTTASPVRHFSLPGHGSSASIHALMAASERGMAFAP